MKKLAMVAVAALIAACSSGGAATQQGADEFAQTIAQPNVVIIDVRTPEEFASGHIEGAVNLPVELPGFDEAIVDLDKDAHYAVYCRSGRRSAIAVQKMSDVGIKKISELSDGIVAWNGPLVSGN